MEHSCKSLIAPGLIDSALKLRLALLFYQHPCWSGGRMRLSEWLCESPWAIAEALEAMTEAGLLGQVAIAGEIHYRLEPNRDDWIVLEHLARCFDDPLRRDEIYCLVRLADEERQFRAVKATETHWQFPAC